MTELPLKSRIYLIIFLSFGVLITSGLSGWAGMARAILFIISINIAFYVLCFKEYSRLKNIVICGILFALTTGIFMYTPVYHLDKIFYETGYDLWLEKNNFRYMLWMLVRITGYFITFYVAFFVANRLRASYIKKHANNSELLTDENLKRAFVIPLVVIGTFGGAIFSCLNPSLSFFGSIFGAIYSLFVYSGLAYLVNKKTIPNKFREM
ncbi:MAG: hypothetical protein AB1782_06810 [Cyanobacteriota bacterium]